MFTSGLHVYLNITSQRVLPRYLPVSVKCLLSRVGLTYVLTLYLLPRSAIVTVQPDMLAALMVLLTPSNAAALAVAGVAVRRLTLDPALPWIYEADWEAQQQSRATAASFASGSLEHDPLSSCHWPASVPLARLLARSQSGLEGKRVIELGCGTGVCALASARAGATEVLATDIDEVALAMTAAAAAAQNLSAVRTLVFDAESWETPLPSADVLILSDLFVTNRLARAHGCRVAEALSRGLVVLVVDPGRSSRASFLAELERRGVHSAGFAHRCDDLELPPLPAQEGVALGDHAGDDARKRRLWLLDTDEGTPLSYSI